METFGLEAELIFGAIKDENMNGKIRVSIVATSLKGSTINTETKPFLNVVNGSNNRNNSFTDNLFAKNNIDQNIVSSIDGATALKLDESYEIKNTEEQNAVIDNFESKEENQIAEESSINVNQNDEIPSGVSIESASYMENNPDMTNLSSFKEDIKIDENIEEEYTPKLFSEDQNLENTDSEEVREENKTDQLFDQDNNEDEE